jgi:hypothetical protein
MISTIVLLCWTGKNFYQKSKKLAYFPGEIVAIGLFLVGVGILMYAIRDVFTQLEMYKIQEKFTLFGGFFHILGSVLIFWFICREFASKLLSKVSFGLGLFIMLFMMAGIKVAPIGSEIVRAPFEPLPYTIIRNYPAEGVTLGAPVFLWMGLTSVLLLDIILYNVLKLKEKEERKKGLLYGLGFIFLIFPMLICIFISPIYARWGYLIGAILLFKAMRIKL